MKFLSQEILVRILFAFTVLSVLAAVLPAVRSIEPRRINSIAFENSMNDPIDIPPLVLRIKQCPTLIQTRSYWHEDYTPRVPFYRPLSLTWFWMEYHLLGEPLWKWEIVSVLPSPGVLHPIWDLCAENY